MCDAARDGVSGVEPVLFPVEGRLQVKERSEHTITLLGRVQ